MVVQPPSLGDVLDAHRSWNFMSFPYKVQSLCVHGQNPVVVPFGYVYAVAREHS